MFVKPDEISNPIGMAVSREHDVVVDVVIIQGLKGSVAVGLVAIPLIAVVWIGESAKPGCDVDSAEDNLVADDSPCCSSALASDQLTVEPVFLSSTHQRTASIIMDIIDVVRVVVCGRLVRIIMRAGWTHSSQ